MGVCCSGHVMMLIDSIPSIDSCHDHVQTHPTWRFDRENVVGRNVVYKREGALFSEHFRVVS